MLLAYAKIALQDDVLASALPDDPDFAPVLAEYFPPEVRDRYAAQIAQHQLRREIIVTALANGMVNRAGSTFAFRLAEETGASADEIVRAHEAARVVFRQSELWSEIEQLDGLVAADTQTSMYLESRKMIERASRWFLRYRKRPLAVARDRRRAPTGRRPADRRASRARCAGASGTGTTRRAPGSRGSASRWSSHTGSRPSMRCTPRSTSRISRRRRAGPSTTSPRCSASSATGSRSTGSAIARSTSRAATAGRRSHRRALLEDIDGEHRRITSLILGTTDPGFEPAHAYDVWAESERARIDRVLALLDDIRTHGVYELATLSVALRELRSLA